LEDEKTQRKEPDARLLCLRISNADTHSHGSLRIVSYPLNLHLV
jgi:hypothetical protein